MSFSHGSDDLCDSCCAIDGGKTMALHSYSTVRLGVMVLKQSNRSQAPGEDDLVLRGLGYLWIGKHG